MATTLLVGARCAGLAEDGRTASALNRGVGGRSLMRRGVARELRGRAYRIDQNDRGFMEKLFHGQARFSDHFDGAFFEGLQGRCWCPVRSTPNK